MKTIGLIGGMSWESTQLYYRYINKEVARRLGGLHSARLLVYSFDFAEIEVLQRGARWKEAGELLADAAVRIVNAGAEVLVLCTNTMHKVADAIADRAPAEFLHIADASAEAVRAAGVDRVGLLGTRFTMEDEFYVGRLRRHGVEVVVPDADDRAEVDRIIFDELVRGIVDPASKKRYLAVASRLAEGGAGGIIAGCTEIGMLIGPEDIDVPFFDTTVIHATAAVDRALACG